jgi:hypothetical protein
MPRVVKPVGNVQFPVVHWAVCIAPLDMIPLDTADRRSDWSLLYEDVKLLVLSKSPKRFVRGS